MFVAGDLGRIVAAQKEGYLTLRETAHLAERSKIVVELGCGHYVEVDVFAALTADYRLQRCTNTRKTGKFAGCGKLGNKKSHSLVRDLA